MPTGRQEAHAPDTPAIVTASIARALLAADTALQTGGTASDGASFLGIELTAEVEALSAALMAVSVGSSAHADTAAPAVRPLILQGSVDEVRRWASDLVPLHSPPNACEGGASASAQYPTWRRAVVAPADACADAPKATDQKKVCCCVTIFPLCCLYLTHQLLSVLLMHATITQDGPAREAVQPAVVRDKSLDKETSFSRARDKGRQGARSVAAELRAPRNSVGKWRVSEDRINLSNRNHNGSEGVMESDDVIDAASGAAALHALETMKSSRTARSIGLREAPEAVLGALQLLSEYSAISWVADSHNSKKEIDLSKIGGWRTLNTHQAALVREVVKLSPMMGRWTETVFRLGWYVNAFCVCLLFFCILCCSFEPHRRCLFLCVCLF